MIVISLSSTRVHAQEIDPHEADVEESNPGWWGFILGAFIVFETVSLGGGIVTAIGSGIELQEDEPTLGWIIPAYVAGGLNLAGGLLYTATSYNNELFLGLGIAHLGIGVLDVIMASLCVHKKRLWKQNSRVHLAPAIMKDTGGNPVYGLGLGLAL